MDIAKTVEIILNALRNLSPMQIAMGAGVLFLVLAPYWYHRIISTTFREMQSQRRDAIEVMESARKSYDSLRQSLPDAREPSPRRGESRAIPEPPKAGNEPSEIETNEITK